MFIEVFPQKILAFQPNIFDRILVWRIGGEQFTGHLPIVFLSAPIDLLKIGLHVGVLMIAGPIPHQEQFRPRI